MSKRIKLELTESEFKSMVSMIEDNSTMMGASDADFANSDSFSNNTVFHLNHPSGEIVGSIRKSELTGRYFDTPYKTMEDFINNLDMTLTQTAIKQIYGE